MERNTQSIFLTWNTISIWLFESKVPHLLEGTDSNRRTRKGTDLQSVGFNHSPTFQFREQE